MPMFSTLEINVINLWTADLLTLLIEMCGCCPAVGSTGYPRPKNGAVRHKVRPYKGQPADLVTSDPLQEGPWSKQGVSVVCMLPIHCCNPMVFPCRLFEIGVSWNDVFVFQTLAKHVMNVHMHAQQTAQEERVGEIDLQTLKKFITYVRT